MATSPVHTCKHCGAKHGGVYDPYVCADCWKKGKRRVLAYVAALIPALTLLWVIAYLI
jgi:hypothetical protein